MKITKVIVENYRLFNVKTSLDFESLCALVGENGTGKTSILEAISLATSKYYVTSRLGEGDFSNDDNIRIRLEFDKPFISVVPDGWYDLHVPCKEVVLVIGRRKQSAAGKALNDDFTVNHFTVPVLYEDVSSTTLELPEGALQDRLPLAIKTSTENNEPTYKYTLIRNNDKQTTKNLDTRSLQITNELIGFPNVFYFEKDREKEIRKGYGSLTSKIIQDLNWRYRKDFVEGDAVPLWEPYYQNVVDAVEDKKRNRILIPLQEKMVDFFGEEYRNLELSLLDIVRPFSDAYFSLREPTHAKQIAGAYLGSGETMILSYYLLRVISELSKEEIIFLIDEPEMHLHPQAQRKLFEEMKSSSVQFIYTTHSDLFVDISKWQSIIRFTKQGWFPTQDVLNESTPDGLTIKDCLERIKSQYQDKRIFIRENNEVMFARKCLLVEGTMDKHGLPALADKLGTPLGDCTVISCLGKPNIHYFEKLCKAFNIDFFVIYDRDGAGADNLIEELASANVASFTTSLEDCLSLTGKNKTFKGLQKIDTISLTDIAQEIKDVVDKINVWLSSST